jgi:hypothetical protein
MLTTRVCRLKPLKFNIVLNFLRWVTESRPSNLVYHVYWKTDHRYIYFAKVLSMSFFMKKDYHMWDVNFSFRGWLLSFFLPLSKQFKLLIDGSAEVHWDFSRVSHILLLAPRKNKSDHLFYLLLLPSLHGFFLVQVHRKSDPPVCKIMDFHKEKYKKEVKEKEQLKTKVFHFISESAM